MNLNRNHFNKALKALALAYQGGEKGAVGHDWEARVMARIRELGPLPYRHGFADLLEQYFWRLAAVAALMALMLGSVLYHQMGFLSEYAIARLFLENRFDHSFFQILGTS
jgi:hypothetical protein